ncbi:2,5-dichloro-2,5-cyclohexadiene-1,4-diol dehydrogenase LinX [Methylobacterium crusticola]|uniref:2,5-dichloro-2,5-cyclohexadiene-1,4-diol dehydrogenase LinX n=1 Tax=Methylobacterium crusticola TaxID=1697972 RepID=A0ABQ4R210_9HYPH|nr:SDR family oxidoreductase [Methylobacterium crusticola]GJD51717.1 2,5-dichloro-2,5-cyclohexadiene-1,4-diol dehydrogenase LinX [Methylobacterium crusticola]
MVDRLKNRVAFVVGAGCVSEDWGNGNATAVLYAREGARVICVDRSQEAAERTRDLILGEGGTAIALRADIAISSTVSEAVHAGMEVYGRIDILHNNVGILEIGGPEEIGEATWDRIMDVNLKGFYLTSRSVLPIMTAQGGGAIVNISSVASNRWLGAPATTYYASKAAVNQLTQTLAVQYAARGIRCNAVLPGLMNTPMVVEPYRALYGSVDEMIAARDAVCPTGKMGTPWDVAYASLFLASDEAKYVNGVLLPVDGGLSCKCF